MLLIASTGISVGVPGVAVGSGPLDGFVGSAGGTVPCPGSGSVASFFTKATLLTAGIPVKFSLTVTTKLNDAVCPKSILIQIGRASCRERGERSGGAAGLQETG